MKKIIIIEDSKIISEIISFHLKRKFNCQVYSFEDGDSLVNNINELNPDVIILDYNFNTTNLNFKNGLEVLIHLRKDINTPVIVFSGKQGRDKAFDFLDAGANMYVSKDDDDFMENLLVAIEETFS